MREQLRVLGLGRDMARQRVREPVVGKPGEGGRRSGGDEAVKQDGSAVEPRCQCGAEDRGQLAPADAL